LQYGEAEGIKVSLQPNPSHLEAVSPVALGKARAKQYSLLKTLSNGKIDQDCALGDKVLAWVTFCRIEELTCAARLCASSCTVMQVLQGKA
jgi:hypothetical protein